MSSVKDDRSTDDFGHFITARVQLLTTIGLSFQLANSTTKSTFEIHCDR